MQKRLRYPDFLLVLCLCQNLCLSCKLYTCICCLAAVSHWLNDVGMKSFLLLKKATEELKWERFKQVCVEPKFFLTPGHKPPEQLTNALPRKNAPGSIKWRPVEGYIDGERHDDGCEVNDWWRGCEVNVICMSYVSQLLQSLVAHLSLLAHPVCVIPAGSFPSRSTSTLLQLLSTLFSTIFHLTKTRKQQPVLHTSYQLKLGCGLVLQKSVAPPLVVMIHPITVQ